MSSSIAMPTSFITSIVSAASRPASTSISTPLATSTPFQLSTSTPQAPTAGYIWGSNSNDGWSPAAIIGIVAAIMVLVLSVPLIAVLLRRYERKRLRETVKGSGSNGSISSKSSIKSSVKESQSLRSIMVTRELQRTSVKLGEGVDKPEPAHFHERAWSRTEVRGGDWK